METTNNRCPGIPGAVSRLERWTVIEARAFYLYLAADVATITLMFIAQASLKNDKLVNNMLDKIIAVSSIVAIGLLLFLVNVTTPASAGPLGILAIFVLSYVILTGSIMLLLRGLNYGLTKLSKVGILRSAQKPFTGRRAYYFASILALGPVMLIGVQSVGKAGIQEVLLISIFMVLGCVYIARRTS